MIYALTPRRPRIRCAALWWWALAYSVCGLAQGAQQDAPTTLVVHPPRIDLEGSQARAQIVVTLLGADSTGRDVTHLAKYRIVGERQTVKVTREGVATPLEDGRTRIEVSYSGQTKTIDASVHNAGIAEPASFRGEVSAVLSKAGCNQGVCHGNMSGKGGFRLSLRGDDPAFDYASITRDASGRRINLARPRESLVLMKPTGLLPHEGGKRFALDSQAAEAVASWIAKAAADNPRTPRVLKLEIDPAEQYASHGMSQQLRVVAHFSDMSSRDVTSEAAYDLSDPVHASITPEGGVVASEPCELTISARYLQGRAVSRLAFLGDRKPLSRTLPASANPIDGLVYARLERLRIEPSDLAADPVFLRRVYLDSIGKPPDSQESLSFLENKDPNKREKLVDALVDRPEFADYWALKWSDLLRNEEKTMGAKGVWVFNRWLRDRIAADAPLDEIARKMITAQGSSWQSPAAGFYRTNRDPSSAAETLSQVFLGYRLQCARCHNHPFDVWTQDDYYGLAAYFSNIKYKQINNKRRDDLDSHEINGDEIVYLDGEPGMTNPRTGVRLAPRPPMKSEASQSEVSADARADLARWLTKDDPQFARNMANRVWYHLLGRGVVDPVDDFRDSNPPSNPPLLDHLAGYLKSHEMRLKPLVAHIMKSQIYQLDSRPSSTGAGDEANFSHARVKLLDAEVLYDAIAQSLGSREGFRKAPKGLTAVQFPGVSSGSAFLKIFGKPERLLTCECERSEATTLAQAFQMINGPSIRSMLEANDNRLGKLIVAGVSDPALLDELYLSALCRRPNSSERAAALELVAKAGVENRRRAGKTWHGPCSIQKSSCCGASRLGLGACEMFDDACDGFRRTWPSSRRAFLRAGVGGFAGLNLASVLHSEARASASMRARAKHVIFLHQFGGPSHIDTFDMKPDAPDRIRGTFSPIATKIPGVTVVEHLPRMAQSIGRFAQVRSVSHGVKNHNSATYYSLTGRKPPIDDIRLRDTLELHPAYGSIAAKLRPSEDPAIPSFVSYPYVLRDGSVTPGQTASFLGKSYDPLFISADPNSRDFGLPELSLPASLGFERLDDRRALLRSLDEQSKMFEWSAAARGVDAFYDRALAMLASPKVKNAFDLSTEDPKLRDAYGRTSYGQSCLLARRLVESGVRFVTVYYSSTIGGKGSGGWDTHADNFNQLKNRLLPPTDQTLPTLIEDLSSRGLLDETLVVWMGEFGRSPKVQNTKQFGDDGRDHWPFCYTMLFAGGGVQGGAVYGSSDRLGAYPATDPVSPDDVAATMFWALGIDPASEVRDTLGRPLPIASGKPISAIFS